MTYREFLLEIAKLGKNVPETYETPHFSDDSPNNITTIDTNNAYLKKHLSNIAGRAKFHNQAKKQVSIETEGLSKIDLKNSSSKDCLSQLVKHSDKNIAKKQSDNSEVNSQSVKQSQQDMGTSVSAESEGKIIKRPPAEPQSEKAEKTMVLEQLDKNIEEGEKSRTQSNSASISGNENGSNMLDNDINLDEAEEQKMWREMEQELEAELRGEIVSKNENDLIWQYSVFEDYDVEQEQAEHYDLIKKSFEALPYYYKNHVYQEPKNKLPLCYYNEQEVKVMKMEYDGSLKDFRDLYRRHTVMITDFIDNDNILKKWGDKSGANLSFYEKGLIQYNVFMSFYLSRCDFQKNGLFMPTGMLECDTINRIVDLKDYGNVVKQVLSIFAGHVVLLNHYWFAGFEDCLRYFNEDLKLIERGEISDKNIIDACILRMMCPKKQRFLGLKKLKFGNKKATRFDGYVSPAFYYLLSNNNIYVYRYMLQKCIKAFDTKTDINLGAIIEFSEALEKVDKMIEKNPKIFR